MTCKQCGNEINPNEKFCGICGAPNDAVVEQSAQPQAAQSVQPEQPVQSAQPQYGQPVQPQYDQSAQPQYGQPVQPQYDQSAQPQYGQPAQPQYGQPAQPQYGQPAQPQYGQPVQPQYAQPVQQQYGQPAQPQYGQYTQDELASSVLKFGILSLVFSMLISLLGVIFGGIAMSKAKNYALIYPLEGKAKTGKILGTIGFIVAIVMMVLSFILMFANG